MRLPYKKLFFPNRRIRGRQKGTQVSGKQEEQSPGVVLGEGKHFSGENYQSRRENNCFLVAITMRSVLIVWEKESGGNMEEKDCIPFACDLTF